MFSLWPFTKKQTQEPVPYVDTSVIIRQGMQVDVTEGFYKGKTGIVFERKILEKHDDIYTIATIPQLDGMDSESVKCYLHELKPVGSLDAYFVEE